MRSSPLVAVLSLLASQALAQAPARQPLSAERSWEIQRIGAPTISPDGKLAVAPVTRFDMKEDKGLTDLWLWATDGSDARRLTTHASSEGSPLFSPDGRHVAFTAQRDDDKAPQLYVIPLAGGEAVRVTTVPTGVMQPKWFPDGKRLAFISRVWPDLGTFEQQGERLKARDERKSKAQVWEKPPVSAWDQLVDEREAHLFSVPVEGGTPTSLTLGTGLELPRGIALDGSGYDISPDGLELAFAADADPAPNRTNLDVFLLALGDTEPRNVTADNPATDADPRYSPDGRWLAFGRQLVPGFYGDNVRLVLRDRRNGATRVVTDAWDRSARDLVWAADSKRLFGAIDDAGTVRAYEVPIDGAPRAITTSPSFGAVAVSRTSKPVLVALRSSFLEPPTLVRVDPKSGAAVKLSTVNDSLLAATDLGTYESVTYAGANGDPIQMWVNYPPGFDRSRKYPLFLLIHGGPHNAITDGTQFRWNAQVFSSWGYVTAWPNFHGSSGFGNAFTDVINPQQDKLPYEDVIKAADWLARQPWIDSTRMVAGGGSYGGYLASIILGRPHPFKALVAHAAVYNWYTQVGADYAPDLPRFGGLWTEENQRVVRTASPHHGAGNFRTPTLVVHGQKDYRVPVNHGVELYQTLLQRGVPTRFLYFPDENHWVLKPQNSLVWYAEVRRWIDRYTMGGDAKPVSAAGE